MKHIDTVCCKYCGSSIEQTLCKYCSQDTGYTVFTFEELSDLIMKHNGFLPMSWETVFYCGREVVIDH